MTRVLFVGQAPETVDFSDPSLPPGFNAQKILAGIDLAAAKIAERGWVGDICMIPPDAAGIATLEKQLAAATYDCNVIGGGMRLPPKGLELFEKAVNAGINRLLTYAASSESSSGNVVVSISGLLNAGS